MYTKWTCRIMGWIFVLLGTVGATAGSMGTYLRFTPTESYITLGLGMISVFAARRRYRVSALTALLVGLACATWGTSGLLIQHPIFGSVEPLDIMIHALATIWGVGTALQDVWQWRKRTLPVA